jgi:hypothetical protein
MTATVATSRDQSRLDRLSETETRRGGAALDERQAWAALTGVTRTY